MISSNYIGAKFVKLLGLPKHTKWFELRVTVNEAVTVKCEYYPNLADLDLTSITTEFKLVEKRNE